MMSSSFAHAWQTFSECSKCLPISLTHLECIWSELTPDIDLEVCLMHHAL
jgi:hypothetical protein